MEAASHEILDGRVEIWTFSVSDRKPAADTLATLSAEERSRCQRCVDPRKRHRFVHARAELRRILASVTGEDAAALEIRSAENGRPYLPGHVELSFNLSHSADQAAVAVARGASVGVDIEDASRARPFARIARRFFADEEQRWLAAGDRARRAERFYRIWTNKEAYVKALGLGSRLPSKDYAFGFDEHDTARLLRSGAPHASEFRWRFASETCAQRFLVSVCVRDR